MFKSLIAAGIAALLPALALAQGPPDGFYRYPSIGGGFIVFAAEGDLWRVPEAGGMAMRLTASEGDERYPKVSPDGRLIAFTAQYDGNDDVYVMPIDGGEPRRLTYHPLADQALGWTADGRVLFRSRRDHPHGDFRIYTISPTGGIPEMIPLEPAAWISFEPKGSRVALQKMALETHNWKRYKGGEAEKIEVGTLEPLAITPVTPYDGKSAFPMWSDDGRIYFVTDRWGRPNLASMKPDGSDVKRLTNFRDYDVRWPAMGSGKIVYQHKMDVWVFDIASGKNTQVPIQLPSDRLQVRERFVDPKDYLSAFALSRDGERIALESRGQVFVTRTRKKGLIRPIADSSALRTRLGGFSPDGNTIAAWSDAGGEEQLYLLSSTNANPPRQLGKLELGWHFPVAYSPDGKRIAFGDEKYKIWVVDASTGVATLVDTATFEINDYSWSPDGRFLAYSVQLVTGYSQVKVWDGTKTHEITDPMFNSFSPTWDPKGKFLYLLSDRYINPFLDRAEARFIVNDATIPCAYALQTNGRLPFGARGEVDDKEEKKAEAKEAKDAKAAAAHKAGDKDGDEKDKDKDKIEPVRVDFDGIRDRFVEVRVPPGNLARLIAVDGKLHWLRFDNKGMDPAGPPQNGRPEGDLVTYDFEKEKTSVLSPGVVAFDVSGDSKVLVLETKDGFRRVEAGATSLPKGDPGEGDESAIDLGAWSLRVNPREEWQQMFREAWRLERDFFYDAKMHGVDWNGVWQQYGSLAPRLSSRDDLEDLLGEMLGELNVGHAYHFGGDLRHGARVGTGLLAADLLYDAGSGFWKIQKIYRGDYPTPGLSSPLARADLHVSAGDWLVAIDGKPLTKGEDYLVRLANRAEQEVELSINTAPRLEGARRIVVKTVGNDTKIRYAQWIHDCRAYVDKASNGQIGYLHLYDMQGRGLQEFARDYPPQWNKRGLIVDDRWNHGGFVAPMILSHLDRKILAVGNNNRYGGLNTTPGLAFHGYLSCIINRQGGSDCETLALGFKEFKLGPVIGTRTWGGWVGIRGDKPFRDGGQVTEPEGGGWDPQGKAWRIEGHGVDPDVELDLGPDGFIHGQDVQLEYAVKDLLKKIAADPRDLPKAPPIIPRPLVPTE